MSKDANGGDAKSESWRRTTLGELVQVKSGKTLKRSEYSKGLDAPVVVAGAGGPMGTTDSATTDGPIIAVGRVGAAGVVNVYREPVWATDNVLVVEPSNGSDFDFLVLLLRSVDWQHLVTGSSQPLLTQRAIKELEVAVPPTKLQKGIVEEVRRLDGILDTLDARLGRSIQTFPSVRRQAISNGCVGQLTGSWRSERSPDLPDGPDLLEAMASDAMAARARRKQYPADVLPDEPEPLPKTWVWASLDEVCLSITDGDHQAPPKADAGVPFITIGSISGGSLDLTRPPAFVPQEYYESLNDTRRAQVGDILYSVTGSYGIPLRVDDDAPFVFQRHIALLRPHPSLSSEYLAYVLESSLMYRQASRVATGIAQLTVPLAGLRALRVPLPPRDEQDEIVTRIRALLGQLEVARNAVVEGEKLSARLRKAVLSKALRGELLVS